MNAFILFIIGTSFCSAFVSAQINNSNSNSTSDDSWKNFKSTFRKSYRNASEEQTRRSKWANNTRIIEENNRKFELGMRTFKMAMNKFGDWDNSEYKSYLGTRSSSNTKAPSTTTKKPTTFKNFKIGMKKIGNLDSNVFQLYLATSSSTTTTKSTTSTTTTKSSSSTTTTKSSSSTTTTKSTTSTTATKSTTSTTTTKSSSSTTTTKSTTSTTTTKSTTSTTATKSTTSTTTTKSTTSTTTTKSSSSTTTTKSTTSTTTTIKTTITTTTSSPPSTSITTSSLSSSTTYSSNGIDWRTKGYITPVKNQGQCGSCWAFSAVAALEGANYNKTGILIPLSEQQLVDCSIVYGNAGCNGGSIENAFYYVIANNGIDTSASYPYIAAEGTCNFNSASVGGYASRIVNLPYGDEVALTNELNKISTISVVIYAGLSSFQFYSSGVYYDPQCSISLGADHGVAIVGYGTDPVGGDYYIVKNSWGPDWGENGYIKMARNRENHCSIAISASYPIVEEIFF